MRSDVYHDGLNRHDISMFLSLLAHCFLKFVSNALVLCMHGSIAHKTCSILVCGCFTRSGSSVRGNSSSVDDKLIQDIKTRYIYHGNRVHRPGMAQGPRGNGRRRHRTNSMTRIGAGVGRRVNVGEPDARDLIARLHRDYRRGENIWLKCYEPGR